ncbi:hypothetical protein TNCV_4248661 [Trichonephila clavipes]|nr:hypothetical protein TNCV_4248661 [Trichonephila clavipes]
MRECQARVSRCLPLDESSRFCGLRQEPMLYRGKNYRRQKTSRNLFRSEPYSQFPILHSGCRVTQNRILLEWQSWAGQGVMGIVYPGGVRSNESATRGLLATDHVILNHGQVTWTTPELAPPSPNYHTTPTGRRFSSRQI